MKLAEFTGEKGFAVAAKAMPLIMKLKYDPDTIDYMKKLTENTEKKDVRVYELFSVMLANEPKAGIELLALLNDKKPDEYEFNAATAVNDMINAFVFDNELMSLFGLRVQTATEASSGLAAENTEA